MALLMILGASAFQVPAIRCARALGHRVAVCDYVPDNPGHALADHSLPVSTTDAAAVLHAADRLRIDGILAYASDPAAPTAAIVARALGLPGASTAAIACLTDKPAFRAHLRAHHFPTPPFAQVADLSGAEAAACAIGLPVMVKPADSSGSKGVNRVDRIEELRPATQEALQYSRSARMVVERWLPRRGRQIAGDGLVLNGRTVFTCFGDEHFDGACSPHAPVGESFPGSLDSRSHGMLQAELDRLFASLGVDDLLFNLDAMIGIDGEPILIEVGPRAGGNLLPQVIAAHTGVDLTTIAIRLALGERIDARDLEARATGFHASWIVHAREDGTLVDYRVAPAIEPFLRELEFIVPRGTPVRRFRSSRDLLGFARLEFPDAATMRACMDAMATSLAAVVR